MNASGLLRHFYVCHLTPPRSGKLDPQLYRPWKCSPIPPKSVAPGVGVIIVVLYDREPNPDNVSTGSPVVEHIYISDIKAGKVATYVGKSDVFHILGLLMPVETMCEFSSLATC